MKTKLFVVVDDALSTSRNAERCRAVRRDDDDKAALATLSADRLKNDLAESARIDDLDASKVSIPLDPAFSNPWKIAAEKFQPLEKLYSMLRTMLSIAKSWGGG